MDAAIKNVMNQYFSMFMTEVSTRFEIPMEQLEEILHTVKKTKMPKRSIARKRSTTIPSAYILFCRETRPSLPATMSFGERSKELGTRWGLLGEAGRDHYRQMHDQMTVAAMPPQTPEETLTPAAAMAMPPQTPEETLTPVEALQSHRRLILEKETDVLDDEEHAHAARKTRKRSTNNSIPEDITDGRQRDMWSQFSSLKINALREQCENNGIQRSTKRDDMIRALVLHRIALEDGDSYEEEEEEEDDI